MEPIIYSVTHTLRQPEIAEIEYSTPICDNIRCKERSEVWSIILSKKDVFGGKFIASVS